uniref:Uncharacterized protein n=1 Tax=Ditylenchus dipsaci TaxID=166011 RepID=A0A915DKK5_9BILA
MKRMVLSVAAADDDDAHTNKDQTKRSLLCRTQLLFHPIGVAGGRFGSTGAGNDLLVATCFTWLRVDTITEVVAILGVEEELDDENCWSAL